MIPAEAERRSEVERLWRERFGQPPPIVAEPEMMLRILATCPPTRLNPQLRTWLEED